jgi:hypothetical protein
MKMLTDKDATAAYSPAKGHPVVIYTCKFKPEHFRRGVEIVTKHFPEAQAQSEIHKKRLNIFLERPSTHEIVNVSFFDEGPDVDDWHASKERLKTVEKLQDMLEKPIDVQVFKVDHVVGAF